MIRATLLAALLFFAGTAGGEPRGSPTVTLIIDDLGNSRAEAERVVRLPGSVVCAILPHTTHASAVAEAAFRHGKPVLLHLPMESRLGQDPGPGQLDAQMSFPEWLHTLESDLASVPHAEGVNNHMGSLLTAEPVAMRWLMRELVKRRLYFVDSRTDAGTLAAIIARQEGVPVLERQVFLDTDPSPAAIARQLEVLERMARRRGNAVAIGHPHPATLAALELWLPTLVDRGLVLVSPERRLTNAHRVVTP